MIDLPFLVEHESTLLARLEQLDLGPVRLLGLFSPGAMPSDLVDLDRLFGVSGRGDLAAFCL